MQNEPFEYTLNMEALFQDKLSELKSYYCREDYEQALQAFDQAPADSRKFRMRDLRELCEPRGLHAETLIADRTLLEQIPTRDQLKDELLQTFYNLYRNAPDPSGYMERLVRRLAPEYENDSVRVAILKKFVLGAGLNFRRFNIRSIFAWAEAQFYPDEKKTFDHMDEQEQTKLVVSKLNDSIFDQDRIVLTNAEILMLINDRIEKYRRDPAVGIDGIHLTATTSGTVADLLKRHDIPADGLSDTERIHACANAARQGVIPEKELAAATAVEKDFRKQLKAINRVSRTGKAGTAADLYRQAKKDALKAKRLAAPKDCADPELLALCNDLAEGNFRVNGKTKTQLYYFAFMFGMQLPLKGRPYDPQRDIVKNLFEDYYQDNLLRLLSGAYADPAQASSVENEPTGEGINYKNFAEAIYIYFLCRDDLGLTPGERIDQAEETIRNCVKLSKTTGRTGNMQAGAHTNTYREMLINILLNKTVQEIPDYILEHYLVVSPENAGSARIMVASEENTASDHIDDLMKCIDDAYDDPGVFEIPQRKDLSGAWKADVAFKTDYGFDWKLKGLLEAKYSNDPDFLKVVAELDARVHIHNGRFSKTERGRMLTLLNVLAVHSSRDASMSTYRIQTRMEEKGVVCVNFQFSEAIAALRAVGFDLRNDGDNFYLGEREPSDPGLNDLLKYVSNRYYRFNEESDFMLSVLLVKRLGVNRRITRSDLIALHLSYYISGINDEDGPYTFPEVFKDYANSINTYLEEARYQPLSEKNIFDLYVVTALYFYLLENNGYMIGEDEYR